MRLFENSICSVYTFGSSIVDGSKVQTKTPKYTDKPCSYWKSKRSMTDDSSSYQNSSNEYELNLNSQYPVAIQDIVTIDSVDYVVNDVIPHPNHKGVLDNYQIFISKTI